MALVNIGESNQNDGFYRYKMPRLITKIEGRGNGIKTNLVNMVDVAKALSRPPTYVTKYFGCVLGAQSKFEEKSATSTVNGAHETAKLVQLLEGFIKKYVQCYGCGNPETEIVITKKQMITLKCAACGYVSDVDMRDKLTTFILNNPPEQKKAKSSQMRRAEKERLKAGEAVDKSGKKKSATGKKEGSKKSKKKDGEDGDSPNENGNDKVADLGIPEVDDEDDDDDVVWQTDTSAAAAEKRIKEQLTLAAAEMVDLTLVEKAKKEKEKQAKSESNGKSKSTEISQSKEESEEESESDEKDERKEAVEEIRDYFNTHNLSETAKYIQSKGPLTFALLSVVLEAIFDGIGKGLAKDVGKKRLLFGKITGSENSENQLNLMLAFEHFCGVYNKFAVGEIPKVFKVLFF